MNCTGFQKTALSDWVSKWTWCLSAALAPTIFSGISLYQNYNKVDFVDAGANGVNHFWIHFEFELYALVIPATKYLIPLLLILYSFIAAYSILKQKQGGNASFKSIKANTLIKINWAPFEEAVTGYFIEQGFTIKASPSSLTDSFNLTVEKDGKCYLVTYDYWRSASINLSNVLELFVAIISNKASGGFIITSGRLTEAAKTFLKHKPIATIDRKYLCHHIKNMSHNKRKLPDHLRAAA